MTRTATGVGIESVAGVVMRVVSGVVNDSATASIRFVVVEITGSVIVVIVIVENGAVNPGVIYPTEASSKTSSENLDCL